MFVITLLVFRYTRVHYIGVLFHTFDCNFSQAEEHRSLYQGLHYKGVRYIEVTLYSGKRFLLAASLSHSTGFLAECHITVS